MPRPIKSFDVFDTLIARRCVEPVNVLHKLEVRAGIPGLAAARVTADQELGRRGQPYSLREIWQEVGRALSIDAASVQRLMHLELEIEHDEVIPIVENLALVRHGDLLISDTYLPADIVMLLLRNAGMHQVVGLVVTNDGKFRGWIWPQLLAKVAIEEHFGDQEHSDGKTASEAGIKAIIYMGARRSSVELMLVERGWGSLADVIREVRLANPFPDSRPQERQLWNLSCQLNFPLLVFASFLLQKYCDERGVSELLFVSRDCMLWHQLYKQLFPERPTRYLYTSRKCLFKPSQSYLEYLRTIWQPGSVIVDLFSTGASWARFFARLKARGQCFIIGHVDDYAYVQDSPPVAASLDMHALFKNSELGMRLNKGVEMLNYSPHPVIGDVVCLPGGSALPILSEALEYDPLLPEAAHRAFSACVEAYLYEKNFVNKPNEALLSVISTLVRLACSERALPTMYSGHQAADAAFLRTILE